MVPTVATRTPITLRSVAPIILQEPGERGHLKEDLTRIGCIRFISKPWLVKDKKTVQELLTEAANQFDMTIHGHPEMWTAEKWREAYGFDMGGEGFAFKTNKFIRGKFQNLMNPKDEFAVADCKDVRAKRVLGFLIPILYPKKPNQVTMTVGITIFGALLGD